MTESVQIAVIAGSCAIVSGLIGAAGVFVAAKYGKKSEKDFRELKIEIDGRFTELIAASRFEGQIEERDNQRAMEIRDAAEAARRKP